MSVTFRREEEKDWPAVENLVRESFWNVYHPGCVEHYVLRCLRSDPAFVPELDIVMEKDGEIIGQNMFMRAVIRADGGRDIPIMTMGPICVSNDLKRMGYGKKLLDYAHAAAKELGYHRVILNARENVVGFYTKAGYIPTGKRSVSAILVLVQMTFDL